MKSIKYIALAVIAFNLWSCTSRPNEYSKATLNKKASIDAQSLGFNPLKGKVINSFINKTHQTMSTLYGNDIAFNHLETANNLNYPNGSILTYVTWQQTPDKRWFGGNIPARVMSIETVRFINDSSFYQYFEGNPLSQVNKPDLEAKRFKWIKGIQKAIIP